MRGGHLDGLDGGLELRLLALQEDRREHAREPVLGRPLRRAPSSEAWVDFCCRAGGLSAWGLGAPRASAAPAQVAEQAALQLPQALLQALAQALRRLCSRLCSVRAHGGLRIVGNFSRLKILLIIIQEYCEGNAGAVGINRVAVDICQLKAQGAQGNWTVEFHEMALVCSGGHHKAQASVNDAFANYVIAQRPLDIRRGGQGAAAQE